MAVTTLKIAGRKYVLMPESEFRKKTASKNGSARVRRRMTRQDRGDVAESIRRLKNETSIPCEEVFKKLGL